MTSNSDTDLQILHGIFGDFTGTINGIVVCKNGVMYKKKEVKKKERRPIERIPTK